MSACYYVYENGVALRQFHSRAAAEAFAKRRAEAWGGHDRYNSRRLSVCYNGSESSLLTTYRMLRMSPYPGFTIERHVPLSPDDQ